MYLRCCNASKSARTLRHWDAETNNEKRPTRSLNKLLHAANPPITADKLLSLDPRRVRDIVQSSFTNKLSTYATTDEGSRIALTLCRRSNLAAKIIFFDNSRSRFLNADKGYGNGSPTRTF